MTPKCNIILRKWALALIPLLLLCLLVIGIGLHLASGKAIVVGRFQLERRSDGLWSYKASRFATFTPSGTSLQAGQSYSLGPLRVTHWTTDWKAK